MADAQNVIRVSRDGTGNYSEVSVAVAAASPGDTLIVDSGWYDFGTISKGVRIVGLPGAQLDRATVIDIPWNQTFTLSGFAQARDLGLRIYDNEGMVHLQDLRLLHGSVVGNTYVTISDSSFQGLGVEDSQVVITNSVISSGSSVGIDTRNSHLTLVDTDVIGGSTILFGTPPVIDAIEGTLVLAGDTQVLRYTAAPEPLLFTTNTRVILGDNLSMGCAALSNCLEQPITWMDGEFDGGKSQFILGTNAGAGDLFAMAVSLPNRGQYLPVGKLLLDPASLLILEIGQLDGSGRAEVKVPLTPALSGFGFALTFQSLVVGASDFSLTTPVTLVF
jgi:hypothetical protein